MYKTQKQGTQFITCSAGWHLSGNDFRQGAKTLCVSKDLAVIKGDMQFGVLTMEVVL